MFAWSEVESVSLMEAIVVEVGKVRVYLDSADDLTVNVSWASFSVSSTAVLSAMAGACEIVAALKC